MDSYNLSYTPDPEQSKNLSCLTRRCRNINGWGPRKLLQYTAAINAFAEMYRLDLMVLDARQYGIVKQQYYKHPVCFDDTYIFISARALFDSLWSEWYSFRLLTLTKNTPPAKLDYQNRFRCLLKKLQKELLNKREYFLGLAGISL